MHALRVLCDRCVPISLAVSWCSRSLTGVLSAASIGAGDGREYARYLESKTLTPARGDYYLTPTGEPAQAPGRWLSSPETLARLGIESGGVDGPDFIALMEGRHPATGAWLRREGAGGGRGGGIDLTFSPPKSVSAVWALSSDEQRAVIERAYGEAVREAVGYLTENVATVRRRFAGEVVEEPARDLVAAEYRHTTARGVADGEPPDPQLHSHVVVTSAIREDGQIVAVASRPIFRAAREVGAVYRSALAHQLSEQGFALDRGTGKGGRYFEIAGVPTGLLGAFSARSREVAAAAERFRARWGRAPERGELRALALENRRAKTPVTRGELQRVWESVGRRFGFVGEGVARHLAAADGMRPERAVEDRIEDALTDRAATFTASELRAVVFEQTVGELAPKDALALVNDMIHERRILPLEGGLMTTLTVRAREQAIERTITTLARTGGRDVGETARALAAADVAERIGAPLSGEQAIALDTLTGGERAAVLIGPAGTGKGVVIDAAARAEQTAGCSTWGVAVSGSTAQRLGRDSPALAGCTLTLDGLVARARHGGLRLDAATTVYFDETGMGDTIRLHSLAQTVERAGAKLVLIGDAEQLPSIGPGGMFDQLTNRVPMAKLTTVRRTLDPDEQQAWADLRAGRTDRAMAHYHARGQLHITDTRDQAVEEAVSDWAALTETHAVHETALISDASNVEINRINARAQHHRIERGELGEHQAPVPGTHYAIRAGDRVALIDQHHQPGHPRVENGTQGQVLHVTPHGQVTIQFDATGRQRTLNTDDLGRVRLAYAGHIHRAQGATVTRTLVVTGGWQTSKQTAYVEASRARNGTDWYVNRHDLGHEGQDHDRIQRLAQAMRKNHAQHHRSNTPNSRPRSGGQAWTYPTRRAARHYSQRSRASSTSSPNPRSSARDEPTPTNRPARPRRRTPPEARRARRPATIHPRITARPRSPRHHHPQHPTQPHAADSRRRAATMARALRRRPHLASAHMGRDRRAARPLPEPAEASQPRMVGRRAPHRDACRARHLAPRTRRHRQRPPPRACLPTPAHRLRPHPPTTSHQHHNSLETRSTTPRVGSSARFRLPRAIRAAPVDSGGTRLSKISHLGMMLGRRSSSVSFRRPYRWLNGFAFASAVCLVLALTQATAANAREPLIGPVAYDSLFVEAQITPEWRVTTWKISVCPGEAQCEHAEGQLPADGDGHSVSLVLDLQPGTTYSFTIEATNSSGSALWTGEYTIPPIPPGACPYGCPSSEGVYDPSESELAIEAGNEAAARVLLEQRDKEQEEQRAKQSLEEAEALKRREEEAARQATTQVAARPACVVPTLEGDTLTAARHALAIAHCRLGTVHHPSRSHGTLHVHRQSARADERLANGTRITLWLTDHRYGPS